MAWAAAHAILAPTHARPAATPHPDLVDSVRHLRRTILNSLVRKIVPFRHGAQSFYNIGACAFQKN
jgi:hypothetical protein